MQITAQNLQLNFIDTSARGGSNIVTALAEAMFIASSTGLQVRVSANSRTYLVHPSAIAGIVEKLPTILDK